MQISGVSLALTWPCRLCLPKVLLGGMPLLQAFPFPSTLGEVTLHLLSLASMFIYSSRGKWVFPPLLWSFPPTATLQAFPLLIAGVCHRSCLLRPGLFIYSSRRNSPPRFQCSGCPTLFATCLFCCFCLLFSFSFFPGWGSVCPGGYADLSQGCLWEYHVPLSSPCGPRFPKPSGCWCLVAAREPAWFLCLM
jgi:hypothetical protein